MARTRRKPWRRDGQSITQIHWWRSTGEAGGGQADDAVVVRKRMRLLHCVDATGPDASTTSCLTTTLTALATARGSKQIRSTSTIVRMAAARLDKTHKGETMPLFGADVRRSVRKHCCCWRGKRHGMAEARPIPWGAATTPRDKSTNQAGSGRRGRARSQPRPGHARRQQPTPRASEGARRGRPGRATAAGRRRAPIAAKPDRAG